MSRVFSWVFVCRTEFCGSTAGLVFWEEGGAGEDGCVWGDFRFLNRFFLGSLLLEWKSVGVWLVLVLGREECEGDGGWLRMGRFSTLESLFLLGLCCWLRICGSTAGPSFGKKSREMAAYGALYDFFWLRICGSTAGLDFGKIGD